MEIGEKKMLLRLRRVMVRIGDLDRVDEEIKNGESNRQLIERIKGYTESSTGSDKNIDAFPVESR
jgi:hypothetical protein